MSRRTIHRDDPPATTTPFPSAAGGRFRYAIRGEVVEVDTYVMTAEQFGRWPRRGSPHWAALRLANGLVLVQRMVL